MKQLLGDFCHTHTYIIRVSRATEINLHFCFLRKQTDVINKKYSAVTFVTSYDWGEDTIKEGNQGETFTVVFIILVLSAI